MISFEEFKSEFKELVDLQIALAGAELTSAYFLYIQFDSTEENNDLKYKRPLFAANSFSADFPTTFNIFDTTIGFHVTVKNDKEEEIVSKMRITVIDILLEQNFTLCKDLKLNGLYLYARFNIPENTFPMYTLSVSAQNLPLLSGLFGDCDPFLRILKKNPNFGTYSMVHESEVHRNTSNPVFKAAKLSLQRLCAGSRR